MHEHGLQDELWVSVLTGPKPETRNPKPFSIQKRVLGSQANGVLC